MLRHIRDTARLAMSDTRVKSTSSRGCKVPLGQVLDLLGPTDATFIAALCETDGTRAFSKNSITLGSHCADECVACVGVGDVAIVAWDAGGSTGALASLESRGSFIIRGRLEPIHGQTSSDKHLPFQNNEFLRFSCERDSLDTQGCSRD